MSCKILRLPNGREIELKDKAIDIGDADLDKPKMIITEKGVKILHGEVSYQRLARAFHANGEHDKAKYYEELYREFKKELNK